MEDKEKQNRKYRIKITIIGGMFVLFFCTIVLRAYQLQILDNTKLIKLAKSQYKTKLVVNPKRGTVYDRNGEILALDTLVDSVAIHPHLIVDKEAVKSMLTKYFGDDKKNISKKMASTRKFEWVKRRIPLSVGEEIDQQKLKGVEVLQEYRRFYPNKDLAGQLLGAVGYDAKALGGLELDYDKYLRSELERQSVQRDARGKFFSPVDEDVITHDLYLTIDKNIQFQVEEFLAEGAVEHKVRHGFAIVMDVDSGDILAMANYPRFNPNSYWQFPQAYWANHAVIDLFEPGSTFKTMLVASALESGKVKPADRFFCENGSYTVGKHVVNDHQGHGWLTVREILKVSSNIGMTKIAQKIGKKTFYDFMVKMGFGAKTTTDFSVESAGSIRPYQKWREVEFSNMAFGQGLAVTGLQMANAYTALAGGGSLIEPRFVKRIVNSQGGIVQEKGKTVIEKILSDKNSDELKNMLHQVTQAGGTATQAHVQGYLSAGKTGTAQKFNTDTGSYEEHDYISSFIGFAPLKDPKIVVYVVYDSPSQGGYFGGVVAAPVFKKITEATLPYLLVAPSREYQMAHFNPETNGPGNSEQVDKDSFVMAQTKLKDREMPDFKGMPIRQVLQLVEDYDLDLSVSGSGVVVNQLPKPGSKMDKAQSVKIELARKS